MNWCAIGSLSPGHWITCSGILYRHAISQYLGENQKNGNNYYYGKGYRVFCDNLFKLLNLDTTLKANFHIYFPPDVQGKTGIAFVVLYIQKVLSYFLFNFKCEHEADFLKLWRINLCLLTLEKGWVNVSFLFSPIFFQSSPETWIVTEK